MSIQDFLKNISVSKVTADSREVIPGALFFAISGNKQDGRKFIEEAIKAGAVAIVVQENNLSNVSVPIIEVTDIRLAYAKALADFYQHPSREICCIGVTGTNGKTSVAWILSQALLILGHKTALSGTLGTGFFKRLEDAKITNIIDTGNTTPDASKVQSFLKEAKDQGINRAVLEVTTHSIDQKRIKYVDWDLGVFTNLTRDHLDYHMTMENYAAVKKKFFTEELLASNKSNKTAVLNIDDSLGLSIFQDLSKENVKILTYSPSGKDAQVKVLETKLKINGSEIFFQYGNLKAKLKANLIGNYNVENLLAVVSALIALGHDLKNIIEAISLVKPVPGRLERVGETELNIFVDYAHTPDALIQVQKSLRTIAPGKLITLFGCGGDRDRGKRPLMGEAVASFSDYCIVTSDNPRSEEPAKIVQDILPGIEKIKISKNVSYEIILDRKEAIKKALDIASKEDVILIAGKGHEDYQIISGVKYPFSDVEVCKELLKERI